MSSSQRAIVKIHYAPAHTLAKHIYYLGMDGKGPDGKKPEFFTEKGKEVETGAIEKEERVYKIVLSPEHTVSADSRKKLNIQQLTRDFMAEFEKQYALPDKREERFTKDMQPGETGRLRWFAASHYNTSNPHSHIVIRGIDSKGHEVYLDPDLVKRSNEIARDLVTKQLGQRTKLEIESQLNREITSERFTQIDAVIAKKLEIYHTAVPLSSVQKDRLEYLEHHMHLATKIGANTYQLEPKWKQILKYNGRKDDYIKTIYHDLPPEKREQFMNQQSKHRLVIYRRDWTVTGKVVANGIADELLDRPYVLVQSKSGAQYFYTSNQLKLSDLKIGSTITLDKGKVVRAPEIQINKAQEKGQGRGLERSH